MEASHVQLFRWVSMALSVIAMFGPGWMFVRGALAALRARALSLDVPISLGLLAGTVWGVVNTIRGEGDIYFDSISVLIFFLLVGRFIQQRQQRAAADSVELLFSLTPSVASRVGEDGIREVPVEALRVNDVVVVLAGASVPVDGVVLVGSSSVDRPTNSRFTSSSRCSCWALPPSPSGGWPCHTMAASREDSPTPSPCSSSPAPAAWASRRPSS
jgi:Cu2+-exporting ATPase